ncbi:hypothetical protein BUY46_03120 [Staphylococcus devriesei]|nr:hypothetical protein BUY46_03120 [Staphylococcus devriesei]
MIFLFILGIVAGMMVPIQTSINSRLGRYTESSFYASTISFFVGTLFLLILNIIFNTQMFSSSFYNGHSIDYHWWVGGLLGVCFLTGNLLLLPRLGATLTVVMTVAGQICMGVVIDTFGLLGASQHPFTFLKGVGIVVLFLGILLMNYIPRNKLEEKTNPTFYLWLLVGFVFGFAPPLQTTINSGLSQQMHSSLFASLISFTVGTIALFILTLVFNRSLKIKTTQPNIGRIKPLYFIGGILGVVFVTSNIILMPFLGAALTTIIAMLGQMLMGVIIDHFGLGVRKSPITFRKFSGLVAIAIGIILLRLF